MILRSLAPRLDPFVVGSTIKRAGFASRKLPKGRVKGSGHTLLPKATKGFITSHQQQAQNGSGTSTDSSSSEPSKSVSDVLRDTNSEENNLLSPVHVPEDPDGILNERHPATKILANSAIVVQRQIEMMNIMLGFEQANRYVIMDPQGNHLGYMAEQEFGMGNMMARQWFRTHRSFTTHVFNTEMKEFHRPFSWINSQIRVYDPLEVGKSSLSPSTALQRTSAGALSTSISDLPSQHSNLSLSEMRIIGEAQAQWAPLRRKYNLFLHQELESQASPNSALELPAGELPLSSSKQLQTSSKTSLTSGPQGTYSQFAYVDEAFLSWDFSLMSSSNQLIGSVNRNFAGLGRELFTDTGVYALRMDSAGLADEPRHYISKTGEKSNSYGDSAGGMTLDQRAVMLATAVSVDFDYFSRQRHGLGGFMPLWLGGGGEGAGAGAAGGVAGEAGAGAVGGVARGAGAIGAEGGAAGAAAGMGTMAGYEAMQRGAYGEDASPTTGGSDYGGAGQAPPGQYPGDEVWSENNDPSSGTSGRSSGGESGGDNGWDGSDGGGGEGGGGGFDASDWF
ncbi:hypothetical protein MMC13_002232 [Lambiella insularis]|nr:hypothetical protein [Lambiella insularis]